MLERSINQNRDNVYAYLALGDAYERKKDLKKAIYVYRDLSSLGINVHGLKEKLSELEARKKRMEDEEADRARK